MQLSEEEQSCHVFAHMVAAELFVMMLGGLAYALLLGSPPLGAFTFIPIAFLLLAPGGAAYFSWKPFRWVVFVGINLVLAVWFGWLIWTQGL